MNLLLTELRSRKARGPSGASASAHAVPGSPPLLLSRPVLSSANSPRAPRSFSALFCLISCPESAHAPLRPPLMLLKEGCILSLVVGLGLMRPIGSIFFFFPLGGRVQPISGWLVLSPLKIFLGFAVSFEEQGVVLALTCCAAGTSPSAQPRSSAPGIGSLRSKLRL